MLPPLVPPSTTAWEARPGIASVLPPNAEGTPYDSRAVAYGFVVRSAPCNRLLGGASAVRHRAFARQAAA